MTEVCFTNSIRTVGVIPATAHFNHCEKKIYEKDTSSEDYVGKITAIFSPYISSNISEKKFISLQNEVKRIVSEIRGKNL